MLLHLMAQLVWSSCMMEKSDRFDGSGDFSLWKGRVENELMRHQLLGYVLVKGYNGTLAFEFKREQIPAKSETALSCSDVQKESADAMHIVLNSLHSNVTSIIIDKSVFDSWETLNTLYTKGGLLRTCSLYDMHRVLNHMWLGDKKR
ncbi:hypothetical protein PHYBOEH_008100 [Phytophthora boehmeriae]|uniref:Uncharacterized protein n=1 Tax=Phytophthora boehmeriae TaxID=109152 RepID=A0A8T1W5I5_9STRA|nr:hypothetical protein PHYBOEH_008100 [Phytophthora boehmeriae]